MDIPIFAIIFLFLLIILNGLFAMSEIAIVSARRVRLQQRADAGDKSAKTALDLMSNPGRFLSSVQIGITLIGILSGAFGENVIADSLRPKLQAIPALAPYAFVISTAVTVLIITYFSLVIGELVPKQIALSNAEKVASLAARPMTILARVASPFVSFLSASSAVVLKVLGIKPTAEPDITKEEINLLISQGAQTGVFAEEEGELVERVFRLASLRAYSIITPRTEINWLDIEDTEDEIRARIFEAENTRYPVAEGDLDDLLGVVSSSDLLGQSLRGEGLDLHKLVQPALVVPESIPALILLERFRESHQQFAMVIDEYGGIIGLVTTEDLLEALVGDLPDLEEISDPEISRRDDGSFLIDGMLEVDRFKELFELKNLPDEDKNYYQTLGGMVMNVLGRVPTPGESFMFEHLKIEVVDLDGNRIDKLLVSFHKQLDKGGAVHSDH